jgi:hypothetical protein
MYINTDIGIDDHSCWRTSLNKLSAQVVLNNF